MRNPKAQTLFSLVSFCFLDKVTVVETLASTRLNLEIYDCVFVGGTNYPATTEMELYTFVFNKMSQSCFEKCTSKKHKEPDLALGEMACVDRCVNKYLEAQEKVGVILQKANESQLAQQQLLTDMQSAFGAQR